MSETQIDKFYEWYNSNSPLEIRKSLSRRYNSKELSYMMYIIDKLAGENFKEKEFINEVL